MVWLFGDWRNYARLPGAERISLIDSWPQVHDRTGSMPFDAHYYYVSGWAARRIVASRPVRHVDVGSLALFANLLSAEDAEAVHAYVISRAQEDWGASGSTGGPH